MAKKSTSLTEAVSAQLKSNFDLDKFKEKKSLNNKVKFKDQKWIPFSDALQKALSLPGIPMGHISVVRGKSNTGKSTTSIEAIVSAQKMGVLPVLMITEMKHDWGHFKQMGFQMDEVTDDEGNVINYDGFFIYKDRSTLHSIEDIALFMADLMDEQAKGNLPYDLLFVWDSVVLSRKEEMPYTNTFLIINKTGVAPAEGPMARPRMTNKGGDTFFYDASLVLTFGNITNSGTSKIKAVKDKKEVEFALRTKISCDKNHVNGITTKGTIVSTVHGFIEDSPNAITKYKKDYSNEWLDILGKGEVKITEDNSDWEEKKDISDLVDFEETVGDE